MLQEFGRRIASRLVYPGCTVVLFGLAGCGSDEPATPLPAPELTAPADERKEPLPVTPVEAPEPFDAPPLSELDKEVGWIDRPVRDGLVLLRDAQAGEGVLVTVADALALKNDTADTNAKILSALGRLPEEGQADLSARIERHVGGDLGSTNPIMISTAAEFDIL
ncbi:MAG: hypothetical protein RLZZ622_1828, partial [Planctomycetota bacterium]